MLNCNMFKLATIFAVFSLAVAKNVQPRIVGGDLTM